MNNKAPQRSPSSNERMVEVRCFDGVVRISASEASLIWIGDKEVRNYVGTKIDFDRELCNYKDICYLTR